MRGKTRAVALVRTPPGAFETFAVGGVLFCLFGIDLGWRELDVSFDGLIAVIPS